MSTVSHTPPRHARTAIPPSEQMMTWADYVESRPVFFPSKGSGQWFLRQHKAELVKLGTLVMHRGTWLVRPLAFDEAVMGIAAADAEAWIQREATKARDK